MSEFSTRQQDWSAEQTVLVVDDNPVTRYSTSRLLRAAGFSTLEAETGHEAIALAMTAVDAVVLDVHLPDMNGFQVCEAIRANGATAALPVIHLSAAYVQEHDKVKGLDAGANAYLTHPVEPRVLIATVAALLRAARAEQAMRQSEAKFRAIYQQAISGICLLDGEGRVVDANPAMLSTLGRDAASLIGQPVADFAPQEWKARVAELASAGGEGGWEGTFPLLDGEGGTVHLEWHISAPLESGVKVAVVSNITERIDFEARMELLVEREQAARSALERLNRMKDDFIAILSHELRNPLNAINLWTQILRRRASGDDVMRGIEAIERSVRMQQRLVADLLDVSMLNVGKLKLEREFADPVALARTAIDIHASAALEKQIVVLADLPDAIPEPIWLDPGRFQQILWNLLSNAIKFSKPGGTVSVRMTYTREQLYVRVHDEGIGITPEFLPYLFDRFTQSTATQRRSHHGLGLGLAIVKQVVEMHGGTITAHSAGVNRGSVFEVTLPVLRKPLAEAAAGEAGVLGEAGAVRRGAAQLVSLDVLVVEDDADALDALATMLRDNGAKVRKARGFADAIDCIAVAMPALIVSDIGLPGRDGYDLIAEIRRIEAARGVPRTPAIALTAFNRDQDQAMALEAGFDAHCAKPLRLQSLMYAFNSIAERAAEAGKSAEA
ncbi:hybrid sensor histidine kinase/response regulator [Cupriavidus respiraculi]|uniref:hybrid sensor histidine kinase/response regulator n=1 Tax=Cupriavidus respiraculi TaxID=195930 RepID=UPI001F270A7B|nr:response regulator [Cupriavidus respiraculi]